MDAWYIITVCGVCRVNADTPGLRSAICSLQMSDAHVNQLPGSSDASNLTVSVGSSVYDNYRKLQTSTRLETFIHKYQSEEGQVISC